MRDIVATIQPEQDVIVRSDVSRSVCVQGAPGTGKTAVGLHRAAYLLYAHRDQLTRQGVLVVGPNESFLRYIRDVLPALGEIDAGQTTIEEPWSPRACAGLNARWPIRGADDAARRDAQGRRPAGRGAAAGRCGRTSGRRPRRWSSRAARGAGGSPAYEAEEIVADAAHARACGTAPPGRCCRSRSRTGSW